MIRLWDAVTGGVVREFLANYGGAASVALDPQGRSLAADAADGKVRLWDPQTGTTRDELDAHPGGVGCLAFGLDGHVLATGGRDGLVRLWDLAGPKEVRKFRGHAGPITAVTLTTRGDLVATGSEDTVVRLWDTVSGEEKARLRGHGGAVTALAFGPDGRQLISGAWDRTARLWDVATGKGPELTGLAGGVRAVGFTPDGRELFIGAGKLVKTWDSATGRGRRTLATLNSAVLAAALTPDGTALAVGGANGLIRIFDYATATEARHLEGHRGPVVSLGYGHGGRLLVSASTGASIATRPAARGPESRPANATTARPSTVLRPEVPTDPDRLWADLAGNLRAALVAQRRLAADPDVAITLLRDRLKPVPRVDQAEVARLIGAVLGTDEAARQKAIENLGKLGGRGAAALARSLAGLPTGSARTRAEEALTLVRAAPPTPEGLRGLRAVETLTRIGTPAARELLERLAGGASESAVTDAAAAALARLSS
jgi:hypothetical protein